MKSIVLYLYGAVGLLLGYYIPYFSQRIIKYKKRTHLKEHNFLDYLAIKAALIFLNGFTWYMAALKLNFFTALLVGIMISSGLIIAYIDICIRIIPNETVVFMVITGVLFQVLQFGIKSLLSATITMVVMMFVFTSVAGFVGFGKVGAGDIKLAGAIGLSLGFPLIVVSVGAMAVVLLIFIAVGLLFKKLYLTSMLPLAPFLISGYIYALIAFIFY